MNSNPLCCCEYFDNLQNHNHILACCCNCQDLDESFDNLITGKGITSQQKRRFMATLQDRIRIPWYGGARHVTMDAILPIFMIPAMILIATVSVWWAVSIFSLMSILLFYFYRYSLKNLQRTKFFLIWSLTSGIILFLVFEFLVVPLLEILVHENVLVLILVVGSLFCIYFVKFTSINLRYCNESQIEIGESDKLVTSRSNYCPICQITVPEQDHHCIWFDCCIGIHNRFMFLFFVTLAIGTLLYTANLTLTSICHPYHFYKTILLPDDCSDVYEQFEISLAFVTAVYSLIISTFLGVFFFYQIWMISIGLTGQEFAALPFSSKLCCGLTAHRPYTRGFFNNWLRTSCYCCRPRRPICNY